MAAAMLSHAVRLVTRQSSNPNSKPQSSSISALLSTLIPALLVGLLFVSLFLIFRRKFVRVFRPRTYLGTLYDHDKTPKPQDSMFGWIPSFRSLPDTFVLNHQSLDGYLYLRFLKMVIVICFVGCLITWPILFPVNATGGGGQTELDLLSFSNVTDNNRFYAHALIAWVFLGFVMFVITRETIYYINLRHAYLTGPFSANRISSRTVLFMDVPEKYLSEQAIRGFFGDSVVNFWIPTDCKKLTKQVEERDKIAMKLENAEIKLSKVANKKRIKAEKKNKTPERVSKHNTDDSQASLWLSDKDRPTHRTKFLIGKKVDTINWSREQLTTKIPAVENLQAQHRSEKPKLLPSVFVEFRTLADAQFAFRQVRYEKPHGITARETGIVPSQVIWKNVGMKKSMRTIRMAIAITLIVLLIIFWAIPVAIVGAISNINYLTNKVAFLSFINNIPSAILGIVTGLLPVVALAILMSLVPVFCRLLAKLGGEVTLSGVELRCQQWYFAFQVIQVFLVATLSSAASAVASQIVAQPSSATSLLSTNLPKASNFYIAYVVLFGLSIAPSALLNIVGLAMFTIVGKFLDSTPRKVYNRFVTLSGAGWGSTYPKFTLIPVIAITYSCIAPLMLGFTAIGMFLVYIGYRYNFFYVLTNDIDLRGAGYARALQHLMVGVYLSELCLIGLFGIGSGSVATGPLVLMIILLIITIIYHVLLNHALEPLETFLPATLSHNDQTALFSSVSHKHYTDGSKQSATATATTAMRSNPATDKKTALLARLFDPQRFASYSTVQQQLERTEFLPQYEAHEQEEAYYNPVVASRAPQLWIVRDPMGISRREVADTEKILPITDEGAAFDEKNHVVWTQDEDVTAAPIYKRRVDY